MRIPKRVNIMGHTITVTVVSARDWESGRQDLEKARHYIDLLLEWEYGNEP